MGDDRHGDHEAGARPKRRRKEARPEEILRAAFEEFMLHGFAATRLEDIARRAQASKGTIYLYFPSKQALFTVLVRQAVTPHLEQIVAVADTFPGSMEAFLRGPFKTLQQAVLESDAGQLLRLLMAEAHAFPELTEFYYTQVVAPVLGVLRRIVARGVASGEFRPTGLDTFPQVLAGPLTVGLVWKGLFDAYQVLDVDGLLNTHLDVVLHGLKRPE